MIILLVGPSAVGKTTLGRICASQMPNCDFIDLDDAVANVNGTSTGYEAAAMFGLAKFLNDCCELVAKYDLEYAPKSLSLSLLWANGRYGWISRKLGFRLIEQSPSSLRQKKFINGETT